MKKTEHVPVLLDEALNGLDLQGGETVVDATLGGGGYTRALLARVGKEGRVIALDVDQEALSRFEATFGRADNLTLIHANYSELDSVLEGAGVKTVDAIVADLGFSSDQMNAPERGLSFQDGPLDMRLNPDEAKGGKTAAQIIAEATQEELADIFRRYGDEPYAGKVARALAVRREEQPFTRTGDLAAFVQALYPKRVSRHMAIHPATRIFQALRIAVNDEHEHLRRFLGAALTRLVANGRLAIVAFHSGEDRIVKSFFREEARGCVCPPGFPVCACGKTARLKVLTKRPIVPGEQEVARNPRARSAKLRIAQRCEA